VHSYSVIHQTITVNDVDFSIRSLKDRLEYDDQGGHAAAIGISPATWSLFGVVWPSSKMLASKVSVLELEGKRVLEIGCGLALSSIVLHQMGVDITASDYHPLAKAFLDKNVLSNDLSPIKYQTGNWETENPLLGKFDLIIGSDILYEPDHVGQVSNFIDSHSSVDVNVMIVDPNRGNRSRFTKKMIALGYTHQFERFNVPDIGETNCKGRILHYQR